MSEFIIKLWKICCDNKELVFATAVAVIGDICFHWHNMLIDAVKSKI